MSISIDDESLVSANLIELGRSSLSSSFALSARDALAVNNSTDSAEVYDDRILRIMRYEGLPRENHANQSGLNDGVTANGRSDRLRESAAIAGQNLSCNSERAAQYGSVSITETEGGHMIVMNDTLGSERIMIRHSNGSGIEIRPDGSILISSSQAIFDIQGNANFAISGSTTFETEGDFKVKAGGEINLQSTAFRNTVNGRYDENVRNKSSMVHGSFNETVKGARTTTTLGATTHTALGGLAMNVKGDLTLRADGNGGIYASGSVGITGQVGAFMSSPSTRVNGESIQIIGGTGTIGGENIVMYNYNMYTGHSISAGDTVTTQKVTADEFVGDLTGRADEAIASDTAIYASYGGGPGSAAGWTNDTSSATVDTKATFLPSAAIASARLQTLTNGVRQVQIDPGDYIRNSIDRSIAHGGGGR